MNGPSGIQKFLAGDVFAVAGASTHRYKYGNKVLRCYQQHGLTVYPVNPNAKHVEGLPAYPNLSSLPEKIHGLSIITPPEITDQLIDEAISSGIHHIWLQPGAESDRAIARAQSAGINLIAGGPCLLVVLGYRGS